MVAAVVAFTIVNPAQTLQLFNALNPAKLQRANVAALSSPASSPVASPLAEGADNFLLDAQELHRPKSIERKAVKELTDKRTAYTKTFLNSDGTKTMEYTTEQQHYQTSKDAPWQEINNTLEEKKTKDNLRYFEGKAGAMSSSMKRLSDGLAIDAERKQIAIKPVGAANVQPERKDDRTIVYRDAWSGVDLEYELRGESVKEVIIVKSPAAPTTFNFTVSGGKVTRHSTEKDALTVEGLPKEYQFTPLSLDVNGRGVISEQRVTQMPTASGIAISFDKKWFAQQPASSFPMRIDPSLTKEASSYKMFKSDGYSCTGAICYIVIGSVNDGGWKHWRSYFTFPYSELNNKTVLSAKLQGTFQNNAGGDTTTRAITMGHASCNTAFNCLGASVGSTTASKNFTIDFTPKLKSLVDAKTWNVWWSLRGVEGSQHSLKPHNMLKAVVTYDTPTPMAVAALPANGATVVTTQPTIQVNKVADADGDAVEYYHRIATNPDAETGAVINSGWTPSQQWTVPEHILQDGRTYYWHTYTRGNRNVPITNPNWVHSFKVDMRTGKDSTQAYEEVGPMGIDLATGNATTSTGTHGISALAGDIGLTLNYNTPALVQSGTAQKTATKYGLTGYYYNAPGSPWTFPTNLTDPSRLLMVRSDQKLNFQWGTSAPSPGLPADSFLVRWKGYVTVPTAGSYTLGVNADDGVRIKLGTGLFGADETVFDGWNYIAGNRWGTAKHLPANTPIPITIEYYEAGGPGSFNLLVRGTGLDERDMPVTWLAPNANVLPDGWELAQGSGSANFERLQVQSSAAILSDSTGQKHEYTWTNGAYKPPQNQEATLLRNGDNTHTVLDTDGTTYVFNAEGNLASVTAPQDDRQPAALKYEYAGNPSRLVKISDGVNTARNGTLHYAGDSECQVMGGFDPVPAGYLCAFKTTDGKKTTLQYKAGNLARIVQPGDEHEDYQYDSLGRITSYRDSLANDAIAYGVRADDASTRTEIGYNASGRVTGVTAPAATAGAPRQQQTVEYMGSIAPVYRLYRPNGANGPTTHISSTATYLPGTTEAWHMVSAMSEQRPGSHAIYSCLRADGRYFAATPSDCYGSGNTSTGVIGYLYNQPTGEATTPYSRIRNASSGYVLEYPATSLSGWVTEEVLGYGYSPSYGPLDGVTKLHTVGAPEPHGFSRKITYDKLYRTTSDTDVANLTTTTQWHPDKDLLRSTTSPTGLKSTTIYDSNDRPVDAYGPAPAAWFEPSGTPIASKVNDVPRVQTGYDEGINGLEALVYDNTKLHGAPKLRATGMTQTIEPYYDIDLSNSQVTPTDGLSIRSTGKIRLDQAGTYSFRLYHGGGARLYVDNQLIVNNWTAGYERFSGSGNYVNSTAGKYVSIVIEAFKPGTSGTSFDGRALAVLHQKAPGQSAFSGTNLTQQLTPAYNLTTSTKTYDSQLGDTEAKTVYSKPEYGLVDKTVLDPTGLNYEAKATYESPSTGFLRQTSKSLPGGAQTNYEYYSATDTRDNPCTTEIEAHPQAGLLKSKIEPDPDGDGPQSGRKSEAVYDASGTVVATRYGSEPWICRTTDNRGRSIATTVPAIGGQPVRTITNNYLVDSSPLKISTTDQSGTITVETDLLGRTIKYIDASGSVTENTFDTYGKLLSRTSVRGQEEYTYDQYDRLSTYKLDSVTFANLSYDTYGRIATIGYPSGVELSDIGRDSLQRDTKVEYTLASDEKLSDEVTYSSSGTVTSGIENGKVKTYSYNAATNLIGATVDSNTFAYEFGTPNQTCNSLADNNPQAAKSGNRTKLTVNGHNTSYCYDFADRLVKSSDDRIGTPVYDSRGNIIELGVEGRKTAFEFDSSNRNTKITETLAPHTGSNSTDEIQKTESIYTRDVQGRILTRQTKVNNELKSHEKYLYVGTSDTPDALVDVNGTVIQKYIALPGGVLATVKPQSTSASTLTLSLSNIHGDIMATIDADGLVTGKYLTGPFGEKLASYQSPNNTGTEGSWNYLGKHQKLSEAALSLQPIQMGARVYIPELGRFLSVDPIEGGTDNNYVYTNNPVNETDITGNAIETALDAAGIAYDAHEFYERPSWGNFGMLAWSTGAAFIPFVPGSWTKRAADAGSKAVTKAPPAKSVPKVESKPPTPKPKPPAKKPPTQKSPKKSTKQKIYDSKSLGRKSKAFGAKQLGASVSGWLNNNNLLRIGWSTYNGAKTFRISLGPSIGWWKNKEIILFRGKW